MWHDMARRKRQSWRRLGARLNLAILLVGLLAIVTQGTAQSQSPVQPPQPSVKKEPGKKDAKAEKPTPYTSAILIEPETGKVLFEKDPHTPLPPASMVKMMVALIVMEKVRDEAIHLTDTVTVSGWASKMGGSQVYLKEGETMTIQDLLEAMMVHSANDATAALAEYVAGSGEAFVDLMNDRAEKLGLKETRYYSVHGLPPEPGQEDDVMSAADLATLGREVTKFPEIVEWVALTQAPFRDGEFTLVNPNRLLREYAGADGIKTGYHNKAGFCVTGSAKRGDLRLIVVVMGAPTKPDCFKSAAQLLNQGFANYRMFVPVKGNAVLEGKDAVVRGGVTDRVPLVAKQDVKVLVKKGEEKKVQVEVKVPDRVWAPLTTGQPVGEIVVSLDGAVVGKTEVAAAKDVAQASWWRRWWPF